MAARIYQRPKNAMQSGKARTQEWVLEFERAFDPATVGERGSFENPEVAPAGIAHVLVGGRFVVRDGAHTGERPGRVLARAGAATR